MNKKIIIIFSIAVLFLIFTLSLTAKANKELLEIYENNKSTQIFDRNNDLISITSNSKNFYALYNDNPKQEFKDLIIKKEDQYFYTHPGFNPFSIILDFLSEVGITNRNGSSTITQQLAKILLENENERALNNKIKELFYTLSLELMNTKEDILLMYINSIYFGNQLQGFKDC